MSLSVSRLRRVVARSPMLQILLFVLVLVAALLFAEYLIAVGA